MFNPATPLSYLDYVLDKVDVILLMSVNPGFGGQSFLPSTLKKLQQARRLIDESGLDIRLEVDGGVKVDNIAEIAAAVQICLWQAPRFLVNQIINKSLIKCVRN